MPLQQEVLLANYQEETPINNTNIAIDQQQQINQNPSKRSKGVDDSFEHEHRLAPRSSQYFNEYRIRPATGTSNTNRADPIGPIEVARQVSFPPFKINFDRNEVPSELAIIKAINKHCKISLSYGRYSRIGNKKSFLLYANSNDQFERLLDKTIWPQTICSLDYIMNMPSKVPTSYSLIATGVPAQWDLNDFEREVKKQHPSIIRVERMLVRGGVPIPKVRIDFSSKADMQSILKINRLLLDDENTAFSVQQYYPPFKILRCYNCQQYNDHVAANCPRKENPVCFRCGENHTYNPNCTNKICCANCKGDHLAGNPNCRVKIEERSKCKSNLVKSNGAQSNLTQVPSTVWPTTTNQILPSSSQPSTTVAAPSARGLLNLSSSPSSEISKKLDLILFKIDKLYVEHDDLRTNFNNVSHQLKSCQETINSIKTFLAEQICPLVVEVGEGMLSKRTDVFKKKLRPLISNFNKGLESLSKSIEGNSNQLTSSRLRKSSSHESISEDF